MDSVEFYIFLYFQVVENKKVNNCIYSLKNNDYKFKHLLNLSFYSLIIILLYI